MMDLPTPWKRVVVAAVGGLTAVGYTSDGQYLLVTSHSGRGLFDLHSGARIARHPDDGLRDDLLAARGIGPVEGQMVGVAGLWGGALKGETTDGWRALRVGLDTVVFVGPDGSKHISRETFFELRAAGFSADGCHFVFATSGEVTLFRRRDLAG
jgi:hypothetical protein